MKSISPKEKKSATKQKNGAGSLIIVGGAEDKLDELLILREIARRAGHGKLIVATMASEVPHEVWPIYHKIFRKLGVRAMEHLDISQPDEARAVNVEKLFSGATVFFFTGGDQLKITTKLGGSPIIKRLFEFLNHGGTIAGTSAGAAVMGKTMLVGGANSETHKVGNWLMAPGLGFVEDLIIDQHFAQRERVGRLMGAIALNPGVLGAGIDENTAIIVENGSFRVIGENAVYVIDGRDVSYTNISEATAEKTMSIHDVKLHILAGSECFDLQTRRPWLPAPKKPAAKQSA
ncbi:MAG: cyanophycinase [Bdellovibrionota bacterium]